MDKWITMLDIGHNGRLGNQLLQWAVIRSLSIKYNLPIVLPIYRGDEKHTFRLDELFDLPFFELNTNGLTIKGPVQNITEKQFHYKPINIDNVTSVINIKGYFQSYKYFSDIQDVIRNEDFKFQNKLVKRCKGYLKEINKGIHIVSIHVRRCDYLEPNFSFAYYFNGKEYCEKAIKYLSDRLDKPFQIIYFSDDITWCKENLPQFENTVFSTYSDIEDMCLMSMCDHNIISNSTFSWWSAWLNNNPNKIVVSPKSWFKPDFEKQISYIQDDFIPKE